MPTPVFADTSYFVALLFARDHLHARASEVSVSLENRLLVTSQMVLTEVLNDFAGRGQLYRMAATRYVDVLVSQALVRIIPQTPELFTAALSLYSQRPDKSWSLTDCASMVICGREGISDVLTHDHHFQQAGFVALLRNIS